MRPVRSEVGRGWFGWKRTLALAQAEAGLPHLFVGLIEKPANIGNKLAEGLPVKAPCRCFCGQVQASYPVMPSKNFSYQLFAFPKLSAGRPLVQWLENANIHDRTKLVHAAICLQWVENGHSRDTIAVGRSHDPANSNRCDVLPTLRWLC